MRQLARSLPIALATLALGTLGAVSAAHARTDVHLSIGVPLQAQPVYVQHHPGYVYSQPGYYVQPGYVYQRPGYGHGHGRHYQRRHGPWGDLDRDGIPNQHDRDRDGDGVRNRHDRQPDNGWRY